jgi:hypothetical protein
VTIFIHYLFKSKREMLLGNVFFVIFQNSISGILWHHSFVTTKLEIFKPSTTTHSSRYLHLFGTSLENFFQSQI